MKTKISTIGAILMACSFFSTDSVAFDTGQWQVPGTGPTGVLTVDGSELSWSDGCNTFAREWSRGDGKVVLSPIRSTMAVCRHRNDILGPLLNSTASVTVIGDEMTLSAADGSLVARLTRLP